MNLDGLTQLEIEQEFDMKKVRLDIKESILAFADTIESKEPLIQSVMENYLDDVDILDVKEVMIALLTILGNERAGIQLGKRGNDIRPLAKGMVKINSRDIPFNVFVKTLYKDRYINDMFKHKAMDFVMDLVVELDTIFFDVVKRVEMVEDGQYRTLTYIRSELLFSTNQSLRAHYERFRLPLIEEPHNWTENKNGGYHLNKSNVITNMGCNIQNKVVLNTINKLQSQGYKHRQDIDEEYNFNLQKFLDDGNKDKTAMDKARAMALTCKETYNAIEDRTIYFEWKFDSRGRLYSTGYDINLQGNKAKKGALRPVLWND